MSNEISKGIVMDPNMLGGTPTIQGTRIPAEVIAEMLSRRTPEAILDDYPALTFADLTNARLWAARGGGNDNG